MSTVSVGNAAEKAVAEFLKIKGYKIIKMNWKTRSAEIDIIAEKAKTVYFIEVKYRQSSVAGDGFDYITSRKLHHMQRAAETWVLAHNWTGPYELLAAAVTNLEQSLEIKLREII